MTSTPSLEDSAQQVRILLKLQHADKSLEVPSEPIAVPALLRRKALSAVVNHLLGRYVERQDNHQDDDEDEEEDDKLPSISFDFLIGGKLLRTTVEMAARRHGLSLEKDLIIYYFPAQTEPESSGESEPQPDWISCISTINGHVITAGYDGNVRLFNNDKLSAVTSVMAHTGPCKCMATALASDGSLIVATGSLDHTLTSHQLLLEKEPQFVPVARYQQGHSNSISTVDLYDDYMVSGDWNGGLAIWKLKQADQEAIVTKKLKRYDDDDTTRSSAVQSVEPLSTFSAHQSQISGVAWLNDMQIATSSWDHSVKVWQIESSQQDCLITLNGSRVVSCLDKLSSQVVATGHPDCTIRLWDIRTSENKEASMLVSDTTLKPSHKAWVSAVQWSKENPYRLASTSHDGTLKLWDIRSSLPLHTVATQDEKNFCLAHEERNIFTGGTDGIVKKYTSR
jgi:ribosome biogenesis protein YTM1